MNGRIRPRWRATASMLSAGLLIAAMVLPESVFAATINPVSNDATGATALANAMVAAPGTLSGASYASVPSTGSPHGTSDALSFFPTNGSTFGILTTGPSVALADDPNNFGRNDGTDDQGDNVRGNTDFDVSILPPVNLNVPADGELPDLIDFKFASEEFPEYVRTRA